MFGVLRKFTTRKDTDDDIAKRIKDLSYSDEDYGIFPPPIDGQTAFDELCRFFLGDDWYTSGSIHNDQVNTEALYQIEKQYRCYVRKELGIK